MTPLASAAQASGFPICGHPTDKYVERYTSPKKSCINSTNSACEELAMTVTLSIYIPIDNFSTSQEPIAHQIDSINNFQVVGAPIIY